MDGDYSVYQKKLDRLFTWSDLEEIIPTNLLHNSVFLARLKTLYHDKIFLKRVFEGIEKYWMTTKSPLIPILAK
jgi:hypothetical protein